jgi:hypothetical protein
MRDQHVVTDKHVAPGRCRRFEISSREEVISFRVHQAIASLASEGFGLGRAHTSPGIDNATFVINAGVETVQLITQEFVSQS